jgi:hypothetical protein
MLGLTRAQPERRADYPSEPSSRSSPYRVNVKATLLCHADSDTSRVAVRDHQDGHKALPQAAERDLREFSVDVY